MEQRGLGNSDFRDYSYMREREESKEQRGSGIFNDTDYLYMREDEGGKEQREENRQQRRPPLPYFMSYPYVEMNGGDREGEADREYFRQMYPQVVRRYIRVIIDVLDRLDIKESYIYDEYPDKLSLERLSETILRLIPLENNVPRETQRNIVRVLLYEEVVRRRSRR